VGGGHPCHSNRRGPSQAFQEQLRCGVVAIRPRHRQGPQRGQLAPAGPVDIPRKCDHRDTRLHSSGMQIGSFLATARHNTQAVPPTLALAASASVSCACSTARCERMDLWNCALRALYREQNSCRQAERGGVGRQADWHGVTGMARQQEAGSSRQQAAGSRQQAAEAAGPTASRRDATTSSPSGCLGPLRMRMRLAALMNSGMALSSLRNCRANPGSWA